MFSISGSSNNMVSVIGFLVHLISIYNSEAFVPNYFAGSISSSSTNTWRGQKSEICSTLVASDVATKYEEMMEKMRAKDKTAKKLEKSDLKVVYEDEHILVVEKPSGVLCVPGKENNPSLTQAVFEAYGSESLSMDKMVVHRLGMDTSGLVVFARSMDALRGLNTAFRTRKVVRKYETLLSGHVEKDNGEINLPIMRDYVNPPYMRVSTLEHQKALVELEQQASLPPHIAKKVLENPKDSITLYEVISREQLADQPVTRVSLTSVSGRTHQLNVHCAAFGHPIAGDKVYGLGGEATVNGGLEDGDLAANRASDAVQDAVNKASDNMCIHAKHLSFVHPISGEAVSFESASPF